MECELMNRHGVVGGREICLNCPYPKCILEFRSKRDYESMMRRLKQQERIAKRNKMIVKMSATKTAKEIAITFNLSPRRVREILQQAREK